VRALAGEGFRHTLDLHTGGEDNIFPHHECEIAQSRCAWDTERFARQWAHVRHLMVEGEKMSKSKGNFYTIRDLIAKGFDPAAIRLELIKTHYRSNANFTSQGLQDSERRVGRWRKCARWLTAKARKFEHHSTHRTLSDGEIWERIKHSDASVRLVRSASHDLNLSVVLAALDLMSSDIEAIDEHPKGITSLSPTNAPGVSIPHAPLRSFQTIPFNNTMTDADFADLIKLAAFHLIDGVLGVIFCPPQEKPTLYDAHTNELRLARDAARKAKDWAASDRLRDELVALGYEVKDTAQGTVVTRKASL
jgi:cysteinyl-tRNA synthetase